MKIQEWLRLLPMELDMVKVSQFANNDAVAPTEKVVLKEVSADLKKLWCYSRQMAKEAATLALEGSFGADDGTVIDKEQVLARCYELKRKSDILKDLFWLGCNEEANSWDIPSIGIRKNWELVSFTKEKDDLPPTLKRLLGMDE